MTHIYLSIRLAKNPPAS